MVQAESERDPLPQPDVHPGHVPPPIAYTGYLLAQAGGHARRLFARVLADFRLSAHHLGVLMALSHLGPTSQQQVSAMVGVDPRNTTPLVDALAELHQMLLVVLGPASPWAPPAGPGPTTDPAAPCG